MTTDTSKQARPAGEKGVSGTLVMKRGGGGSVLRWGGGHRFQYI